MAEVDVAAVEQRTGGARVLPAGADQRELVPTMAIAVVGNDAVHILQPGSFGVAASLPHAANGRFTEGISVSRLTEVGRMEPLADAHRRIAVHRLVATLSGLSRMAGVERFSLRSIDVCYAGAL